MDDQSKRIASLTPQQRELLVLRLKQKGLLPPLQSNHSSPNTVGATRSNGQGDVARRLERDGAPEDWKRRSVSKGIEFSLYFFSADGSKQTTDKYRLLLESAKFADAHGFSAVWTPERHFQDFGGLYPNPSVLSAALAVITERVKIRAGSVALPLHNPIRVVEEWAVVDNLSKGRVGISFASGWHRETEYPQHKSPAPPRHGFRGGSQAGTNQRLALRRFDRRWAAGARGRRGRRRT